MLDAVSSRERFFHWRRRWFRWGIWNGLYRFWFKLIVEGWENIPADGPVLMVGNHIHALDPLIMISFFPGRDIVPMAKVESFSTPFMRFFVRNWGAIPVNRGEADMSAMKNTLKTIQDGKIGMLYIEGTRSATGLIKGQSGSVFVALKSDAVVVPVAIWGTPEWPRMWLKEMRRVPIYIRFGEPFRFNRPEGRLRDHLDSMTEEAMYRISSLLPEEWRGMYDDLPSATTNYLDFDLDWVPVREGIPPRMLRLAGMK